MKPATIEILNEGVGHYGIPRGLQGEVLLSLKNAVISPAKIGNQGKIYQVSKVQHTPGNGTHNLWPRWTDVDYQYLLIFRLKKKPGRRGTDPRPVLERFIGNWVRTESLVRKGSLNEWVS